MSLPPETRIVMVGTATSSNNYFRQIGASIGSAIVGSIFASNLAGLLADRLSVDAGSAAGSANDFTPALVHGLPDQIQSVIIGAYNDALTPVFLAMLLRRQWRCLHSRLLSAKACPQGVSSIMSTHQAGPPSHRRRSGVRSFCSRRPSRSSSRWVRSRRRVVTTSPARPMSSSRCPRR